MIDVLSLRRGVPPYGMPPWERISVCEVDIAQRRRVRQLKFLTRNVSYETDWANGIKALENFGSSFKDQRLDAIEALQNFNTCHCRHAPALSQESAERLIGGDRREVK